MKTFKLTNFLRTFGKLHPSVRRKAAFVLMTMLAGFLHTSLQAQTQSGNPVSKYNVTWNELGQDENSSMPLGNGDFALNGWTEQNGDIVLLLAKGDTWSETTQLLKLGRVRISLSPNPFVNTPSFTQVLKIDKGLLEIRSGNNSVRVWADANHPVIRVAAQTEKPVSMKAVSEVWRTQKYHRDQKQINLTQSGHWEWNSNPNGVDFLPDTVLSTKSGQVAWCHFNATSMYPLVFEREHLGSIVSKYPDPILNSCFGVVMKGKGMVNRDKLTLESSAPSRTQQLNIYALTEQVASPGGWLGDISKKIVATEALSESAAWKAHEQWWATFWNRSWIHVTGTPDAEKVAQGYAMQRFMTACAGRAAYPVKFNGSLFTVGNDLPLETISNEAKHDPDYRRWGPCYWNQNTRHIYWPLIASGDYDLLMPWFDMYLKALPLAKERTKLYYNHGGASFIETMFFWGLPNLQDFGWNNPNPDPQSGYMRYHVQGSLEVTTQMLDYYDNTQDKNFLQKSLLPFAEAIVIYYNEHWKRGADGKILFSPSQAIEMYQVDAVNPTPDIAGLKSVVARLKMLPSTTTKQKALWAMVEKDMPEIPLGTTAKGKLPPKGQGDPDGRPTILPAKSYGIGKNTENPELYAVFPYRIYTLGKPDLELARNTFTARLYPLGRCWGQDGMESALLGLTDDAKKSAIESFTSFGKQKFLWFWAKNNDWPPDMDNGGAMTTLQLMLMQTEGKIIRLTPSWPKEWTADFKLYAPQNTTVEGHIENGKISKLKITPAVRAKDVIIGQQ
ncbi:MAG: hypothetical protein JWN56_884 [Sphingobacteriales bacterium]|nr:hypothetical protein [Sphingobacteriales bacterium]